MLEHVAGTASVLANNDGAALPFPSSLCSQGAEEAANQKRVFSIEVHVGFATETIGAKILSHFSFFLFLFRSVNYAAQAMLGCTELVRFTSS